MGSLFDKLIPFGVGHRSEITVAAAALFALLKAAVPSVTPVADAITAAAPYLFGIFMAAKVGRDK